MDDNSYPRVIVLGSGEMRSLKILGFLVPMEDYGILKYVDTFCGVSIGAVISLLIVSGYTIREIISEVVILDIFKDFNYFNLTEQNRGTMSNEPLKKRITQLIINKFGNVPSLDKLYLRTGKSFISVTLNVTDELTVIMTPFSHPNILCVDAAMFSMNIPFALYQGKIYADGSLANPYPINYFDDGNTNVLGIYNKIKQSSISNYHIKIIYSLLNQRYNQIVETSSNKCKHVTLESNFTYGDDLQDKVETIVNGFNQGKKYIQQVNNNNTNKQNDLKYQYPPYYLVNNNI